MGSIHKGNIAIVGAAETDELGVLPDTSVYELHANSALRALEQTGLTIADVDGFATTSPNPLELAHYLGITTPRWVDGTMVGGCSYFLHLRHAAAAISAGLADVVLITHGESGRSRVGSPGYGGSPAGPAGQWEHPYGALAPFQNFTVPVMAWLNARGMKPEDLALPVVSQREYAIPNERAFRRTPTTIEEVINGPKVAWPFTRDMCCVVTDGGGALVLVSAERAKDMNLSKAPVYLQGSGESVAGGIMSQMPSLDTFEPMVQTGKEAFQTAGLTHSDIDHLMIYDAFAHLPLWGLEDLGFVGKGESADFYRDGHASATGKLPMNTSGGGMSYTHTGMYGMFAIQEAVRQLRGEAVVQIPNVKRSFVQGFGFFFGATASLILSNEQ